MRTGGKRAIIGYTVGLVVLIGAVIGIIKYDDARDRELLDKISNSVETSVQESLNPLRQDIRDLINKIDEMLEDETTNQD